MKLNCSISFLVTLLACMSMFEVGHGIKSISYGVNITKSWPKLWPSFTPGNETQSILTIIERLFSRTSQWFNTILNRTSTSDNRHLYKRSIKLEHKPRQFSFSFQKQFKLDFKKFNLIKQWMELIDIFKTTTTTTTTTTTPSTTTTTSDTTTRTPSTTTTRSSSTTTTIPSTTTTTSDTTTRAPSTTTIRSSSITTTRSSSTTTIIPSTTTTRPSTTTTIPNTTTDINRTTTIDDDDDDEED